MRSAKGLSDIFFAILPLAFIERVTQLTRKYCYDDWVVCVCVCVCFDLRFKDELLLSMRFQSLVLTL